MNSDLNRSLILFRDSYFLAAYINYINRCCNFEKIYTITLVNKLLVKELLDFVITKFELTLKWIHKTEGLQLVDTLYHKVHVHKKRNNHAFSYIK